MSALYLRLPDEITNQLDRLSEQTGRSKTFYAKKAIMQFVVHESEREKIKREIVQAHENYLKTGLHATGDEVIEWIESWGTDNEKPMPICHT